MSTIAKTFENLPENIVEAYSQAARMTALNSDLKEEAFEKVIDFCDSNQQCSLDSSIKRNMLMFWSYSNIATAMVDAGRFEEAFDVLQKAQDLPEDAEDKIDIGFRMLEVLDRCKFSIPQKAVKIVDICHYLQEAYRVLGDQDGLQKMEHLQAAAQYLLNGSKRKN